MDYIMSYSKTATNSTPIFHNNLMWHNGVVLGPQLFWHNSNVGGYLSLTHGPTIFSLPITLCHVTVMARSCEKLCGPKLFRHNMIKTYNSFFHYLQLVILDSCENRGGISCDFRIFLICYLNTYLVPFLI